MSVLLKSKLRYLIPFMFETNEFDALTNRINKAKKWELNNPHYSGKEQDLYDMVLDSLEMNEGRCNIGCSFSYCKKNVLDIVYTGLDRDYPVSVSEIGLYLFRLGVGILWYEVSVPADSTLDELITFQNRFKELTYESYITKNKLNGRYTFELASDKETPILMGHWLKTRIMPDLGFGYEYFSCRKDPLDMDGANICDKALLYTYAALSDEDSKEALFDAIFRLTNGYTTRYKRKDSFENDITEPFRKAYCYATINGCGYFSVPEESNMRFYTNTFVDKFMLDYFVLYILAQYQLFSVLRFTRKMESELSADSISYQDDTQRSLDILDRLETDINVFLIKSFYSSVSNISHQNEFYEYLIKRLRTKENIEGLTIGLESLHKLQESRQKKRLEKLENDENQERQISDDRMNIGLGMISLLTLFSAVADGLGSSEIITELFGISEDVLFRIDIAVLVFVCLIGAAAIYSIMPSLHRSLGQKKGSRNDPNDQS